MDASVASQILQVKPSVASLNSSSLAGLGKGEGEMIRKEGI